MKNNHYTVIYQRDSLNIRQIWCNYCDYAVSFVHVKATRLGHKWPRMSHDIKRHLRDKHGINLYKKDFKTRDKKLKKLQIRTLKVLSSLGINSLEGLRHYLDKNSIYSLLKVKNFGRKSLNDLVSFCNRNNIKYYY